MTTNTRALAGLRIYSWPARLLPDRYRRAIVGIFFGLLLVVGLRLVPDYGSFSDESSCRESGQVSMVYLYEVLPPSWLPARAAARLATTPPRQRLLQFKDRDYGVAFELPMTLVEKAANCTSLREVMLLRHSCVFLVCFAGVVAFYWLATQRLGSWRAGLLGAALLVLSPRQFADFFYNAKDAVFLACFLLATATAVAFVRRPRLPVAAWHALACAVAIDVRIMGVLLPVCTLALVAWRAGHGEYAGQRAGRAVLAYGVLLVASVITLWPFLWSAPWSHFREAFASMSRYQWDAAILHQGRIIPNEAHLPWSYALVWIGITMPILYLAGLAVSLYLIGRQLVARGWRLYGTDGEWQDLLCWALGVGPLLTVILLHSVLYDGWRQLYFVYPPLLLLALRGLVAAWRWQPAWPALRASWPVGVALAVAAGLATIAGTMVRLHPLQNLYFNAFAGSHPEQRYEYDYWGLSLRQGLTWIAHHDKRPLIRVCTNSPGSDWMNGAILPPAEQSRIRVIRNYSLTSIDQMSITERVALADYFITTYRFHPQPYTTLGSPVYSLRVDDEGRRVFDIFRLP